MLRAFELLSWVVALGWLGATWIGLRSILFFPRLPPLPSHGDRGPLPKVTAILAARDEQARIERTLERLLAQTSVELQAIVVDDRSSDATPAILSRIAARDPRLETLRVESLPAGWLGKPHACQMAAEQARGEWLLFTDADVWMEPDVVSRAIAAGEHSRADHVCLLPREAAPTFAGRVLSAFLLTAVAPLAAAVNRDRRGAFMGVGAFNLVRAEAYRRSGGHAALRLEVVDDMKLGLLLARAGHRTRAFDANRELEVHWAPSVAGLMHAVEKNAFALFDFRVGVAVAMVALPALPWVVAAAGPFSGTWSGVAAACALATLAAPALVLARRHRLGWLAGILAPLAVPVPLFAILRSVERTLRAGGIVWRNTFHPLSELRRGLVAWTRA